MSDTYLSRKQADAQYRPKGYGLSPGLQRARAPYRVRNAVTGILVGSFAVGVWAYSLHAVKQDTFEDVDEEAKALVAASRKSAQDDGETRAVVGEIAVGRETSTNASAPATSATQPMAKSDFTAHSETGLLVPLLDGRFPQLLHPTQKTLVWGAPPVDRIGRIGDTVEVRTNS